MKKLLIIGAGGHAKVIADLALLLNNFTEILFFDDNKKIGENIFSNYRVIGACNDVKRIYDENCELIIAIGNNKIRHELFLHYQQLEYKFATLIHPNAVVSKFSHIGTGSVVFVNAAININATVGDNCIINTGVIIEHDCKIDFSCHIAPNVTLSGNVVCGKQCWFGVGATVIENIKIGSNVFIAAGSVVVANLKSNLRVVGVPAKEFV